MKRIVTLATVVLMVMVLAVGCAGKSGDDGTKTKTISILTPYLSSVTTNEMVESLKNQAKEKGWKTEVIDTKSDIGQLASRMEDVIMKKVDAIVLVSTDPNQLKEQIERAASKNIPVFGCDSGYIEGMAMNATSDNAAMSKMMSDYLFEKIGDKGNIVVLTHRPHPGVLKRSQTLDEILKEHKDINVLTEQQVQVPGPIENARKQMESILLANKDENSITAVWAGWDEPAIGAAQAIEAAGRSNIIVAGIDGNSQAIEMIKQGTPLKATVKQNFSGMAEIVIGQIDRVFGGGEVEKTEMYAQATLITQENAGQ
ncbi:D-ribose-binding periplasmic protein precursor [Chlamydia abortus]|uniref:Sugar ABC transporter substrate-binding protein n=1 Tax=Paenibacillus residui TaxID=629724 RepID=A0ABW3D5M6_9BACL|nr:substrate-binding domain-containing protein [Paenibacillus sp. 32O-W]SHE12261.1 D-ribose-binding periplasmic protein precursor [Chlamydia abortus]